MRVARTLAAAFAAALIAATAAQAATPELSASSRLAGPPRGRGRPAVLCRGLRGRPLLRQRVAYHGRDGRRVGAAAEAGRRRLVRHRRPVGRAGDDVLQRLRLHPLRAAGPERPAAAAHRRRARRQPGRPLRPADDQPVVGRQDRHGQGRRALRADGRLPLGLHGRDAQRQRQHRRPGVVHGRQELQFTDDGALPGAPAHHYAALVAADQPATRARRPPPAATTAARSGTASARRRRSRCRARATTGPSARAPAASCATR